MRPKMFMDARVRYDTRIDAKGYLMTEELKAKRDKLTRKFDHRNKFYFTSGFNAAHDLMQERIRELEKIAKNLAQDLHEFNKWSGHFDDCNYSELEDEESDCNCGLNKRTRMAYQSIEKYSKYNKALANQKEET